MSEAAQGRAGRLDDAIDGVVPERVVEPESIGALAAALALASSERRTTIVRGGGTKLGWGRVPSRIGQVLSTARLVSPLVHREGDLTATVGAGVRLADLNAHLAKHRQWLPVESAFAETTIGGLVATNESGPLRHRYGTPRDLLIGVTLALADGRVVKAGGIVVKNVAGYDLGRFVSGSLGSLAVVLDATFKLAPRPACSVTVRLPCGSPGEMGAAVAAVIASQLDSAAIDVAVSVDVGGVARRDVLVRFATSPAAANAQAEACRALLAGGELLRDIDEVRSWDAQVTRCWRLRLTVRCAWSPADLDRVLPLVEALDSGVVAMEFAGRAAVGAGYLHAEGEAPSLARLVERLRASQVLQHVVVLHATPAVKERVDVWGPAVAWEKPLGALKRALDPGNILGAARGPAWA